MNKKHIFPAFVVLALCALTAFSSCRKKENPKPEEDKEIETASDNNVSENADNDITAIGFQLSENSGTLTTFRASGELEKPFLLAAACASITPGYTVVGTNTFVNTYTVDFGTAGCTGADGRVRKGKLFFDFSESTNNAKYYRNPGFKMKITSQSYMVDGFAVQINQKHVTNITLPIPPGPNPGINLKWKIVADIKVTKPDNKIITWNCDRTKELINTDDPLCYNGQNVPINWTKAKIKLNGNASGTNSRGEQFTATASELVRDFNCTPNASQPHRHPFISGKIVYTPGDRSARTIDYGNGSCDLSITVTVNGQTFVTNLP